MGRDLKEKLEEFRNSVLLPYASQPERLFSDYEREYGAQKDYNGRQLFELLQNCDDQKADKVEVYINNDTNELSIYNTGAAFSFEGFKALLMPNYSSKIGANLIGNKGLGFRSILSWASRIEVISTGLRVVFSKELAKKELDAIYEKLKNRGIEDLDKKLKLSIFTSSVVPMPILACPEIELCDTAQGWSTQIKITLEAGMYDNMLSQISELNSSVLFFVNHITHINICGSLKKTISILRQPQTISGEEVEVISYDGFRGVCFKKEGHIPVELNEDNRMKESERYQIKIVVPEQLKPIQGNVIRTYFPTQVNFDSSFYLHASLSLDSTRNHINKTRKNAFVLGQAAELIKDVALLIQSYDLAQFSKKKSVDWDSYKFLQIDTKKQERIRELGFEEKLIAIRKEENIYPCIDGKYRNQSSAKSASEAFSGYLMSCPIDISNFSDVVIPGSGNIGLTGLPIISNIAERVALHEKGIGSISERADLIHILTQEFSSVPFQLLIDDSNTKITHNIFTPATQDIVIRESCRDVFSLINRELFDALIDRFKINELKLKSNSRELINRLKGNYEIKDYEPQYIYDSLVSLLESKGNDVEVFSDVIQSMREIHEKHPRTELRKHIKLHNKEYDLVYAHQLMLSDEYALESEILKSIYKEADYLVSPEFYGWEDPSDHAGLAEFFAWLGVNRYSNVLSRELSSDTPKVNDAGLQHLASNIEIHDLLIWLYKDKEVREEVLRKSFCGMKIIDKLQHKFGFNDHLIGKNYVVFDTLGIDYSHEMFRKQGLTTSDIDSLLGTLGAKRSIEDISYNKIVKILDVIKSRDLYQKELSGIQTIYRDILAALHRADKFLQMDAVSLYAQDSHGIRLYLNSQIYFSDKRTLPMQLRDEYPLLYFPKKSGGKEAVKRFRINDLDDVIISSVVADESGMLQGEFFKYFAKMKPCILALVMNDAKEVGYEKESKLIEALDIRICKSATYSVNGKNYSLQEHEYIYDNESQTYYYCSATSHFDELKAAYQFAGTLGEIVSITLRSSQFLQSNFILLLKDSSEQAVKRIKDEIGEDIYKSAVKALSRFSDRFQHWLIIYKIKHGDDFGVERMNSESENLERLFGELGVVDHDLKSFTFEILSDNELHRLKRLFASVGISLEEYNYATSEYKIDISDYHLKALHNCRNRKTKVAFSSIWRSLNSTRNEKKSQFMSYLKKYNCDDFSTLAADLKSSFEEEYDTIFAGWFKSTFLDIDYREEDLWAEIEATRNANLQKLIKGAHLTDEQLSCLYFDGQDEMIKGINAETRRTLEAPAGLQYTDSRESEVVIRRVNYRPPMSVSSLGKPSAASGKIGRSIGLTQERKNEIGKSCEAIVLKYLEQNYPGFVLDQLDKYSVYDMKYSPDEGKTWKIVEVKNFSAGHFHISDNQVEFAKKNRNDYEIWLVDGNEILTPITDFVEKLHELYVLEADNYKVKLEYDLHNS